MSSISRQGTAPRDDIRLFGISGTELIELFDDFGSSEPGLWSENRRSGARQSLKLRDEQANAQLIFLGSTRQATTPAQ